MNHFFKYFIADPLHGSSSRRNNPGRACRPWLWYFSMAWVCLMMAGFSSSQAWGFSLGSMKVKSNFGERFNASILFSGPSPENLRITIGSTEDYHRLGLERPDVLDRLYVKMLPAAEGSEMSVDLLSDKPLFYPSFNLVVKAQYDGQRTLYENYLITVDFRQSVSLKLKADQPKKQKEESEAEQKPVPQNEEVALAEKPDDIPESPITPEKSARKVVAVHPTPLIVREIVQPDYVASLPKPRPSFKEPTPQVSRSESLSPELENVEDKTASAIGLLTQILKGIPTANIEKQASRSLQEPSLSRSVINTHRGSRGEQTSPSLGWTGSYGPLKSGETLMEVIERLDYKPADRKKVAVALWLGDAKVETQRNPLRGR